MSEAFFVQTDHYISSNMEWAVIPYGNKFMSIYKGQQVSVHNSVETAKKFIQRETKKK